MQYIDRIQYAHHLTSLSNWNMTAEVRPHYKLKQHIASNKLQNLSLMTGVNAVFGSLEPDRDFKISPMFHLHLLLDIDNHIVDIKKTIADGLNIRQKQVVYVQPVKGLDQTAKYVTKRLNSPYSHHDFYMSTT